PQSRRPYVVNLWAAALVVAFAVTVYGCFFRSPHELSTIATLPPAIPGWDDLVACSVTTSLDEKKSLSLSENGQASLQAEDQDGKISFANGEWRYEAASKRYSITLNGETTTYALLSRGEPMTCILFKGPLAAADLTSSWFSFPSREEDMRDFDYRPDR